MSWKVLVAAFLVVLLHPAHARQAEGPTAPKPDSTALAEAVQEAGSVLRVTTRLVLVDVVATDKRGNPVRDLRPEELQVFEEKVLQRVRHFYFKGSEQKGAQIEVPPGVYTNWMAPKLGNLPPTILLLDGLNTRLAAQTYSRAQMVRVVKKLPSNTPIAVFALGRRLLLLQDFTSDPERLQQAIERALRSVSGALLDQDYRDDPNSASNRLEGFGSSLPSPTGQPGGGGASGNGELQALINMVRLFMNNVEAEEQALRTDVRVDLTLGALRAIAHYAGGYKGRKNLIWVSSSFPLSILPGTGGSNPFRGTRNYGRQVEKTTRMLTDAQVAIYPVDVQGVQTPAIMDVSNAELPVYGSSRIPRGDLLVDRLGREFEERQVLKDSMHQLAKQTGGILCPETNGLDTCVLEAIEDGNSYYVLGYYPSNSTWDGSFRRIKVKTTRKGVKLRYRRGYFAGGTREPGHQDDLREAVLDNPWPATGILMVARPLRSEKPGEVLYHLAIDGQALTFVPEGDQEVLDLEIGVGIFDARGKRLSYSQRRLRITVSPLVSAAIKNQGYPHTVSVQPHPKAARMRLAVRDLASGLIGTVDVPVESRQAAGEPAAPAL